MGAIDIGDAATDRASYKETSTRLNLGNPANDSGSITSVEIYAVNGYDLANCKVGTFSGSDTDWDDRDYETIGTVTSGSKQTFSGLDIDVVTNDIIGIYFSSGRIESSTSGGSGLRYLAGDWFGAGAQTYYLNADDIMSLYGTGATVEVNYPISSSVAVGVLVSATRVWDLTRASTVLLGVLVSATRAWDLVRSASVLIGNLVSATATKTKLITSSVIIGVVVTASRKFDLVRAAAVSIGVLPSVTRVIAFTRSAPVLIGTLVSATKLKNTPVASTVLIGVTVTASRLVTFTRSATVLVGNLVSASRTLALDRTSTVYIGVTASATKVFNKVVSSTVYIGVSVSAGWNKARRYFAQLSEVVKYLILGSDKVKYEMKEDATKYYETELADEKLYDVEEDATDYYNIEEDV